MNTDADAERDLPGEAAWGEDHEVPGCGDVESIA